MWLFKSIFQWDLMQTNLKANQKSLVHIKFPIKSRDILYRPINLLLAAKEQKFLGGWGWEPLIAELQV